MKKIIFLIIVSFVISSCVSLRPPKQLDNICKIFKEKRSWKHQIKAVDRKWGVPPYTIMSIIHQESRFRAKARPYIKKTGFWGGKKRASSAYGYAQALNNTWKRYQKSVGRKNARRTNFKDSIDFIGWYINENNKRNGIAKYDTKNQYLAYHEGMGGYKRGLHLKKPWLLEVAKKVQRRSNMYKKQLSHCY